MRTTSLFIAVAVCLLIAQPLLAQEDTTPPVLLDFTITPVVFDTSTADVQLDFCVTAADDLSGVADVSIRADDSNSSPLDGVVGISLNFNGAVASTQICGFDIAPIGSAFVEYLIEISLIDSTGNRRVVKHPLHPCTGIQGCNTAQDLCTVGFTCSIENRILTPLPDRDNDGHPDDADNCPDIANPNQADADLDLIGDVCDPFPNDRDNEQAQCELDLATCLATGMLDTDGDGEADQTDKCPNTPTGAAVDDAGCSQAQFCAAIDTSVEKAKQLCERSDWLNDQPLDNHPNDCMFVKGGKGQNGLCAAK